MLAIYIDVTLQSLVTGLPRYEFLLFSEQLHASWSQVDSLAANTDFDGTILHKTGRWSQLVSEDKKASDLWGNGVCN